MTRAWWTLAVVGALLAWSSAAGSPLYPRAPRVLTFSHQRHAALGIECLRCHVAAQTSRSAVDLLLPTEAACRECHRIDRRAPSAAACGACHLGFAEGQAVSRVSSAPPGLKHSHAAHRATPCATCHPPAAGAEPAMPEMSTCLGCHRDAARPQRCTECHLSAASGRIDTSVTETPLRPRSALFGDAHGPGFATDHGAATAGAERTCGACHEESFCSDCHAGTVRALTHHPEDFLRVHAHEARRAGTDCSTCHRLQSFCVGCHERVGVATRVASEWQARAVGSFHPQGWARPELGRDGNLHAAAARRNVTTCASCHREDECLPCHSADAGGARISPHPRSWRGSARCRALDRANRRMCLRCHVDPAELGCDFVGQGPR